MLLKKDIFLFTNKNGKSYIKNWLKKLDVNTRARINVRLTRLKYGVYGDYKKIDSNLSELRFFFGKGYRVYFTEQSNKIIILLYGGDKSNQQEDIKKAKMLLKELNDD